MRQSSKLRHLHMWGEFSWVSLCLPNCVHYIIVKIPKYTAYLLQLAVWVPKLIIVFSFDIIRKSIPNWILSLQHRPCLIWWVRVLLKFHRHLYLNAQRGQNNNCLAPLVDCSDPIEYQNSLHQCQNILAMNMGSSLPRPWWVWWPVVVNTESYCTLMSQWNIETGYSVGLPLVWDVSHIISINHSFAVPLWAGCYV